jgi:hypothetical protein
MDDIMDEGMCGELHNLVRVCERRNPLPVDVKNQEDKCLSDLETFLQDEIWANIPECLRGTLLTKAEEEAILGYGDEENWIPCQQEGKQCQKSS